jgi:hypothetical protein
MALFSSKTSKRTILSLLLAIPPVFAFSHGDDLRHSFNQISQAGIPLEKRDVLTHRDPSGNYSAVISGEYISRTGSVPIYAPFSPGNMRTGNMDIDWNSDDAFTQAFRLMEEKAAVKIDANADLQALRHKENWTAKDCAAWNRVVGDIVACVVQETPGLDRYRTDTDHNGTPRTRHLNDLGGDIRKHSCAGEFDCEGMSIVKIALLERVADRFQTADQRTNYFYVSGMGEISRFEDAPGGHAFIIAEKDGQIACVIEATEQRDPYHELAAPVSFADFVAGKRIVCRDSGGVYGFEFTHAQAERDRVDAGIKTYPQLMEENRRRRQELIKGWRLEI